MWIHWKKKKMRFTHKGKMIRLTGIKDCTTKCHKLLVRKLKGLIRKGGVAQLVHLKAAQPEYEESNIPEAV